MSWNDFFQSIEDDRKNFAREYKKEFGPKKSSQQSYRSDDSTRQRYATGGNVRKSERVRELAAQGRYGDTDIAEIGPRTARALDVLIHGGHKEINPRTGLREYPPRGGKKRRRSNERDPYESSASRSQSSKETPESRKARRAAFLNEYSGSGSSSSTAEPSIAEIMKAKTKNKLKDVRSKENKENKSHGPTVRTPQMHTSIPFPLSNDELGNNDTDSGTDTEFGEGFRGNFKKYHLMHVPTRRANDVGYKMNKAITKTGQRSLEPDQRDFPRNTIVGLNNAGERQWRGELPAKLFTTGLTTVSIPESGQVIDIQNRHNSGGPYRDYMYPKSTNVTVEASGNRGQKMPHHLENTSSTENPEHIFETGV